MGAVGWPLMARWVSSKSRLPGCYVQERRGAVAGAGRGADNGGVAEGLIAEEFSAEDLAEGLGAAGEGAAEPVKDALPCDREGVGRDVSRRDGAEGDDGIEEGRWVHGGPQHLFYAGNRKRGSGSGEKGGTSW